MRLFIALNLSNEVKNQVKEIKNILKANSSQGKFVNEEHMHITIEPDWNSSRWTLRKKGLPHLGVILLYKFYKLVFFLFTEVKCFSAKPSSSTASKVPRYWPSSSLTAK